MSLLLSILSNSTGSLGLCITGLDPASTSCAPASDSALHFPPKNCCSPVDSPCISATAGVGRRCFSFVCRLRLRRKNKRATTPSIIRAATPTAIPAIAPGLRPESPPSPLADEVGSAVEFPNGISMTEARDDA
jgi:hypothetical protein